MTVAADHAVLLTGRLNGFSRSRRLKRRVNHLEHAHAVLARDGGIAILDDGVDEVHELGGPAPDIRAAREAHARIGRNYQRRNNNGLK